MTADAPTRPIVVVLADLLTVEARMAGLGARGAELRQDLEARARVIKASEGVASTWRAPGLGTASFSDPQPRVVVKDRMAFGSWLAQRHPTEVAAHVKVPADVLPRLLELLEEAELGRPLEVRLEVAAAFEKQFLDGCAAVDEAPTDDVFAPDTGDSVDGLHLAPAQPGRLSVRLDPEAKARAAAELADPVVAGILAAPLGSIGTSVSGSPVVDEVHDAEGEPEYSDDLPPVPLDPEGAALHATVVQGGFSTPAIEAFRILEDAWRSVAHGVELDARWRAGVRETLAWLDEHSESDEVARERARWTQGREEGWRTKLELAVAEPDEDAVPAAASGPVTEAEVFGLATDQTLDSLLVPALQVLCSDRELARGGRKAQLIDRLRAFEAARLREKVPS